MQIQLTKGVYCYIANKQTCEKDGCYVIFFIFSKIKTFRHCNYLKQYCLRRSGIHAYHTNSHVQSNCKSNCFNRSNMAEVLLVRC